MATFNLGCAYARAHRTKDALQEYEALYAQVKRLNVRSDHPYYHSVVQALGLAYRADGREAKAIPYLEESLQLIEKRKGPNPGALWSVRHHLGWAYLGAGRQSEAVKVFDANLKIAQPPQDVTSMEALGWAIREVDIDRAIALYEKTRALREERNDPKAIRVARSQVMVLRGALRLDESLALIDEILPKYEQQYGTEHVETLKAILERARTLSSLKRYDEAIALGADAAGRLEKTRGDTDAETLTAQSEWAKILERAGRNLEAAEVVSRVVAARRRTPGGRDTQLADALLAQGLNLHKGKRSADAEPLLRECMEIRMKEIPDSWTTASAKAWLGAALHDQGKVAEAEPLLIDGFTEMSQRIDTIPSWGKSLLRDPAQRLIAIYTAQNKPEEAAKWQKRLEAPLSDAGSSTSALPISPTK